MVTLARSGREARIAAEFTVNAVNVMRGAETLSAYHGLPDDEAFRVEYWALEEAKLRRMPPERPLSRRVALVTGAAGGIGGAIARRLAAEGACVVVADIDAEGADALAATIGDEAVGLRLDVTDEASVDAAFDAAALAFGGVDLLVNCAGVSAAGPLIETTTADYDRVHRIVDRGSFLASRAFARHVAAHGLGGDIVYIVSKNAVVAGPDNVAYSAAKAAQLHQMRLLAAELAPQGVRVNAINPDAVIEGSKIFAGRWGDDRAAAYGVPRERLGEYYAQRTLLKREIVPDDVAAACFVLVSGQLDKTTGAVIPVDGGIPAAFLR
jgi:NAD(P)-dependent dehydrogenase (short-subunit alcohol dehydrogenase family)